MLLIEEFIEHALQLMTSARDHVEVRKDFFRNLQSELRQLDPMEWESAGSSGEKLTLFLNHYESFEGLTPERQEKRIANGFDMIAKLRILFLVPEVFSADNHGQYPAVAGNMDCAVLEKPLQYMKGIGVRWKAFFDLFEVKTVKQLFFFFPRIYTDRRKISRVCELFPSMRMTLIGSIEDIREKKAVNGLTIQLATLRDATGTVTIAWYNQPFILGILKKVQRLLVTGTVRWNKFSGWEIDVQDYEEESGDINLLRTIVPVYRSKKGFPSKSIRKMIQGLSSLIPCIKDPVPDWVNEKRHFISLSKAVYGLHHPKSQYYLHLCRKKMVYNEFFYFQLAVLFSRRNREAFYVRPPKEFGGKLSSKLVKSLSFQLTSAQKKVYANIRKKLQSNLPVNVLLQGDVGCGKTIVAEMAILDVIESGFQTAFMAPTSILAQQHFQNIKSHFEPLGIQPKLLISNMAIKEKENIKEGIRSGEVVMVIGTHALLQQDVDFKKLGFALIDEQHRFGVKQRELLKSKGEQVDALVMSATPIPRTLALAVYGDLDVETIDEVPPERQTVRTVYVHDSKRNEVYDFILKEIEMGNQAYLVYPIIEESDTLDVKAATKMFDALKKGAFKNVAIGLLHGRLKEEEKEAAMEKYASGEIRILVATTVIEVGIDVPKATVIAIENPERFGLAQLHQLRGRVGRSERKSHCFLITQDTSEASEKRLKFFAGCNDGFQLAEYDLQTRGPGDFLGVRQHGLPQFEFGDMVEDANILYQAREDAQEVLSRDVKLDENAFLREFLEQEYKDKIDLYQIG